jgi:large repetitive protein
VVDYSFLLEHGLLEQEGLPGEELTFEFTIINTGHLITLFDLDLDSPWPNFLLESITLHPGDSQSITVDLSIPLDVTVGETVSHIFKTTNTNNGAWAEFEMIVDVLIPNRAPIMTNPIPNQTAWAGLPFHYTVADDTFEDPDGDELAYSAYLEEGDKLPDWLSFDPQTRTLSGEPVEPAVVSIIVSASDGEFTASTSFELAVRMNNAPQVANPIPNQIARVGELFQYTFPENIFEDQDEDPLAYSASSLSGEGLPGWLSFNPGTRTFSGEPLEAGVYQIRITASDGLDEIFTGFELEVLQISTLFLPIVTR